VLATYSKDGYYFEGFEYWMFATPWIVHYLDAQQHVTGENLFDQPGLRQAYLYVAHSVTPGGEMMFDFGDVFEGPITRAKRGEDYQRSHPDGHFETNYNLLYDLAGRFHDSKIQGVADWLRGLGHTGQEEWWTLAWRDNSLKPAPISSIPTYHWFRDHDVAYWRSDWSADATAVAFKCGPAEGHEAAALKIRYPEWHFEQGHAHPDVNSFMVWARGAYLTGDSGYSGVPKTIDHNTLLIDGKGQGNDGVGHDAWAKYDYARLNEVHISKAEFTSTGFVLEGEGAAAYDPSLGLTEFNRRIDLRPGSGIAIHDTIAASGDHTYTETLHADASIQKTSAKTFLLKPVGSSSASLTATVREPRDAKTQVEPNVVMGPGIPGSVDKGKLEQRGERLLVNTSKPSSQAVFDWILEF
jgi:heparinase II/III-like protein